MSIKDNSIEQEQQMPELEKNNQLPENESVYQKSYIRLRPGMFIGRIGDGSNPDDAIYSMLKEIVDNAVDEFLMGFGERIDITLEQGMVSVRDYGRGIPLEKLVKCVTKFSPIWKADTADYVFYNIGCVGAGTKVVNALSSKFEITTWREGKCRTALFHEGEFLFSLPDTLSENAVWVILIGIAAVIALLWFFLRKNTKKTKGNKKGKKESSFFPVYLILMILPVIRFFALSNHAYLHYFFTYRALMITISAGAYLFIKTTIVSGLFTLPNPHRGSSVGR